MFQFCLLQYCSNFDFTWIDPLQPEKIMHVTVKDVDVYCLSSLVALYQFCPFPVLSSCTILGPQSLFFLLQQEKKEKRALSFQVAYGFQILCSILLLPSVILDSATLPGLGGFWNHHRSKQASRSLFQDLFPGIHLPTSTHDFQ